LISPTCHPALVNVATRGQLFNGVYDSFSTVTGGAHPSGAASVYQCVAMRVDSAVQTLDLLNRVSRKIVTTVVIVVALRQSCVIGQRHSQGSTGYLRQIAMS
jgi:hypothetical protein